MKNIITKTAAMMCLLGFHAVCFSEESTVTEVVKPAVEAAQTATDEKKAAAEEKAKADAAAEKAKATAEHGHSHD